MYERLLDGTKPPSAEELAQYCGEQADRFRKLQAELSERFQTTQQIRFPYGKKYGWCVTHRYGKKLICDVFAEAGAFTVMLRLSDAQYGSVYPEASAYGKQLIDGRYPCGDGGWIHYRVTCEAQFLEILRLLDAKCANRPQPAGA